MVPQCSFLIFTINVHTKNMFLIKKLVITNWVRLYFVVPEI